MITAEAKANAALNASISANQPTAPAPVVTVPPQTNTVTTTVVTPGFAPNGVVASVQTAPAGTTTTTAGTAASGANTAVAGVQTAPQTGTQRGSAVAGVSNLPSTNTGDTSGLLGLGSALMALGASFLLRLPTKRK